MLPVKLEKKVRARSGRNAELQDINKCFFCRPEEMAKRIQARHDHGQDLVMGSVPRPTAWKEVYEALRRQVSFRSHDRVYISFFSFFFFFCVSAFSPFLLVSGKRKKKKEIHHAMPALASVVLMWPTLQSAPDMCAGYKCLLSARWSLVEQPCR